MLDFRYDTFLDLCETLNYSRTAENLHLSQPTVTQHIQHLVPASFSTAASGCS